MASISKDNVVTEGIQKGGAPVLTSSGTTDVKGEYPWTLSNNRQIRSFVPGVRLTEYRLTQSGELRSLKNTATALLESGAALGVAGGVGASQIAGLFGAGPIASAAATIGGIAAGAIIGGTVNYRSDYLYAYRNLYAGEPTGNRYVLPYLNVDNMTEAGGTWQSADESAQNMLKSAADLGTQGAKALFGNIAGTNLSQIMQGTAVAASKAAQLEFGLGSPGAAIEKIKKFAPKESGDSITLVFYLYNTINLADIRRNWNFLFRLTYQNLPNRRSINLLDPPCVYEVDVPGLKRFPIASIESLKVTNEGTTRLVNINTGEIVQGATAGTDIKIIPEAYKVSMTIRCLLINSRNLFLYNQDDSSPIRVITA